jgi:hypothetical protein
MKMAELLNQQAMTPMELPQQAGVKISPYAGLAKMLQSYTAGMMQNKALQQQAALAEKYQAGNQADVGAFMQAIQGAPAKELAGPAPQGAPQGISQTEVTQPYTDAQGVQYKGGEPTQGGYIQPAQAPDRQRAMALALGSQNPTLQGAGGAMLSQMLTPPESAFAKLNPKDYTPDTLKLFMATGGKDFSVLKPLEKLHFADTGAGIQALNPYTAEPVSTALAKELSPSDKQQKELADRAFTQLSTKDKADFADKALGRNISAQQLFFDTGMRVGNGLFVNPLTQPSNAPQPNVPPMRPPVAPQGALTPPNAPIAAAPVAQPSAYTPLSQLSPKAQQQMAMESMQAQQKKERGMQGIGETIDQAKNILQGKTINEKGKEIKTPLPTQSYGGMATDFVAGVFGGSPKGSAEADRLKVLGGSLVMAMPRMEGPQSDRDVSLYREMAGQVGDSSLSVARRLAALDQVEKLYRKYDKTSVENLLEKYK